jgi:glucose 1-dehydrogenase
MTHHLRGGAAMDELKGHSALITGAMGGIGRAIAEAYSAAGASVVLHSRAGGPNAEQAIAACRAKGAPHAAFVAADFFEPTEKIVDRLFNDAIAANPDIDILVNNAGGCVFAVPFEQVTFEQFEKLYRLNLVTAYFLTQRFVRRWIERGVKGRILMIGSINGRLSEINSTLYDSAKGAIEMLTKTLAVELAPRGIRVNGLSPGLVRSPITNKWLDASPADLAWMKLHTPNHSVPGPEACAGAAVFLVSDAAEHICGHMLMIDGGMSVWQQPPRPGDSDPQSC